MLLDSTFLHDLLREHPDAVGCLDELIQSRRPVAISALTVFEVGIGLRGDAEQHREQFRRTVDELEGIPLGPEQARRAMEIQRNLYDRGDPIGAVDVLIAGSAATREDAAVLTRNVDEFERVDGVEVETY